LGTFEKGKSTTIKTSANQGSYLFNISGHLLFNNEEIFNRDAIGIFPDTQLSIEFKEKSEFIVIEIPMPR